LRPAWTKSKILSQKQKQNKREGQARWYTPVQEDEIGLLYNPTLALGQKQETLSEK
jgi:hypothetical protein